MKWFVILISFFSMSLKALGSTESLVLEAKALSQGISIQDGPNCFNASLFLQGFVKDLTYSSEAELDFYLDHFCTEKTFSIAAIKSGDIIAFLNPSEENQSKAHTAVFLGENKILEKNSLYGSLTTPVDSDPEPGRFLYQSLSESLYSAPKSKQVFQTLYKKTVFSCQPKNLVRRALEKFQQNSAIQQQLQFRAELARAIAISDRTKLEEVILNTLTPRIDKMSWDQALDGKMKTRLEIRYLHGLLRSNSYQMYLLNCSDSIKKHGECYEPRLSQAIGKVNAWFDKIYQFEALYKL